MVERVAGSMAEDYVRVLWKAEERHTGPVVSSDLAAALGVTTSTVSTNLRKLHAEGLVHHEPYHRIALTEQGRTLAVSVIRRHRLVEAFLHDHLGFTWDEVHAEAEVLEHSVSDLFVDRIDHLLGLPATDPHGDPIPRRDGSLPGQDITGSVDSFPTGAVGAVTRVWDDDPETLRWLTEHGIGLGSVLVVGEHRLRGTVRLVTVGTGADAAEAGPGQRVEVPAAVGCAVWLTAQHAPDPA